MNMTSAGQATSYPYWECVTICHDGASNGCSEAFFFIQNDFAILKTIFRRGSLELEESLLLATKEETKKETVRVRKKMMTVRVVKMKMRPPKVKVKSIGRNIQSKLSSRWTSYITRLWTTFSTSSAVKELYVCLLRLKSSAEEKAIRMHIGSGEASRFRPDNLEDDLILQVQDLKGNSCGQVVVQIAAISNDQDKIRRWWSIYREPEHEFVGKVQLDIHTSLNDVSELVNHPKPVTPSMAYEVLLKGAREFQKNEFTLSTEWKWLLSEFASLHGLSEAYTNLRT